jgi:hypothetical protein
MLVVLLGVDLLEHYGWGLFVGLPFAMGLSSALVYGYHAPRQLAECLLVALLGPLMLAVVLMLVAIEGAMCLQFRLEPVHGDRTRLQGTTWYRHDLWPSAYWRLWSDAIIHRIHERVLGHIQQRAEAIPRLEVQLERGSQLVPERVER